MITKENSKTVEYGLSVTFDGKNYSLINTDYVRDYPIGGLICEYCRLIPTKIKDIIISCPHFDQVPSPENVTETLMYFHDRLFEEFYPIQATMIYIEFQNTAIAWFEAKRNDFEDEFIDNLIKAGLDKSIFDWIFQESPYNNIGSESVLQMFLSIYCDFVTTYAQTGFLFNSIIKDSSVKEDYEEILNLFSSMYTSNAETQKIDFRIMNLENTGLTSIYTIKSSLSLLLFEIAHCIQSNAGFVKCQNCNKYFVPEGRSDTLYCSYSSPQNKEKTCREIGAQIARANKEKTDIVTGTYRKIYMRYKMMTRRHPYNREIKTKFDQLTTDMKEWRERLSNGTTTTEEVLEWLSKY